jgi:hypothetical protein
MHAKRHLEEGGKARMRGMTCEQGQGNECKEASEREQ